jgi:hypothetical protein
MHEIQISRRGLPARAVATRMAKVTCGVALTAALLGAGSVQPVAAQDDDTIVLTAGGSTLTVSPGNASAVSAVAEAHASPGHAETIAAGARAVADCEDGALAEGSAALAVAHPDEGALTEASLPVDADALAERIITSVAEASNNNDGNPIRKVVENKCHVDKEEKAPPKKEAPPAEVVEVPVEVPVAPPVQQLPETGIGMAVGAGLSSLLAAASAAAALGSVALRSRRESGEFALQSKAPND